LIINNRCILLCDSCWLWWHSVHLIPVSTANKNGVSSKSRKRIMPDPVTEPPVTDPVYEALLYCNIPSVAERSMEGHAPHHFKLVSVNVFIRHGDRYPLYVIPKTKRPEIDCTLVANRKPYHPKLEAFVSHMSKGSGTSFESPLNSLPLYPNHPLCEMGELTQTGRWIARGQEFETSLSKSKTPSLLKIERKYLAN
uniref:2-phosphoxylose phosphatase 1 n=1 Tax=Prolemur simus TaxID=1328070 RepID=A0A8C9AN67_PROSS